MRLFIAAGLPADVRGKLASAQGKIGDECAGIKWVEEENLHVTLRFLGEVDEGKVEGIKESLGSVKQEPFVCSVRGLGAFPGPDRVRVIWAGVEPETPFMKLHGKIDNALERHGFQKDSRFHPHVTLGRVRFVRDRAKLSESVSSLRGEAFGNLEVGTFALKSSRLTPSGPVYGDVGVFGL